MRIKIEGFLIVLFSVAIAVFILNLADKTRAGVRAEKPTQGETLSQDEIKGKTGAIS